MRRIQTIRSHVGLSRAMAEWTGPVLEIPRIASIPSPYRYSPVQPVFQWGDRLVFTVETSHRHYEVYELERADVHIGERVAFGPYLHPLGAAQLDVSGLSGTVVAASVDHVAIKLDSDRFADALSEWDNCIEFDPSGDRPPLGDARSVLFSAGDLAGATLPEAE